MAFNWDDHPIIEHDDAVAKNVAPATFSWNDHPVVPPVAPVQTPPQAPGGLASMAAGALQGATAGFAPRIAAAAGAAYQQVANPSTANFSKDYESEKKDLEDQAEMAKAKHPWMYGAGNVAGSVGTTVASGGAGLAGEGALGAAKLGATFGGAEGLSSTKDLTASPLADITNAGAGALAGGATAGVIQGVGAPILGAVGSLAGRGIKTLADLGPLNTFSTNLGKGLEGTQTIGIGARKAINDASYGQLANAQKMMQADLNTAKLQQGVAKAASGGVDISQWVGHVGDMAENAQANYHLPEDQAAISKILDTIQAFTDRSGTDLTPQDALYLKRTLGTLGSMGDTGLKNDVGRGFIDRIMSPLDRAPSDLEQGFGQPQGFTPLKTTINNAIEGLDPANKKISQLLNAGDEFPKSLQDLVSTEQGNIASSGARSKLDSFLNQLPDDTRAKIEPMLRDAAKSSFVTEKVNAAGLNKGTWNPVETGPGMIGGMGNLIGLGVNATKQAAQQAGSGIAQSAGEIAQTGPGKMFQVGLNKPADWFTNMGTQLSQAASPALKYMGKALQGAATKDQLGRNAVIFTLTQNPAYRDALEKHMGNGEGIDQSGPPGAAAQINNLRNQ